MESKLLYELIGNKLVTSEMIHLVNELKANFKTGRYPLANGAYANAQTYTTYDENTRNYENHRLFIDIQIVLEGKEVIWVASAADAAFSVVRPYVPDIELMNGPVREEPIVLNSEEFLILHPGQAHKYGCTIPTTPATNVKKVIIKVPYTK